MCDSTSTATPTLEYEQSTGYLVLAGGRCRQVFCRPEGEILWIWDKEKKIERPLTMAELLQHLEAIKRD